MAMLATWEWPDKIHVLLQRHLGYLVVLLCYFCPSSGPDTAHMCTQTHECTGTHTLIMYLLCYCAGWEPLAVIQLQFNFY